MARPTKTRPPASKGEISPSTVRVSVSDPAPPPIVPLLAWQKSWLEDESRFKMVVASVQIGKSFATSLEFSLRALRPRRSLGILLSASERQSLELMEKVKMHTQAWGVKYDTGAWEQTSIIQHTATFPNGNRIIALPANPDTARGYSGDVFLDEFALHRDAKAIWAAMMSRATRGYDVRVASTFKGKENKFFELAKLLGLHEGAPQTALPVRIHGWSGHWADIYLAREQGLNQNGSVTPGRRGDIDIEGLREAIDDEEIFQQDYCCIPTAGSESFIPLELVLACESSAATTDFRPDDAATLYAGFDVGRKKDRTVFWILEHNPETGGMITRGVIWMENTPFADQLKQARAIAPHVAHFTIDSTGIGAMLAEELHKEFPWAEAVDWNAASKERAAQEVKKRLEERTLLLPENARVRRGVTAVKRYVSSTGVSRFDAQRTQAIGHSDEFWALALALTAAGIAGGYVPASRGLAGRATFGGLLGKVF